MALTDEARREIGIDRIGSYLLKGWVLTDTPCSRCSIPTMRSKSKDILGFCVLCDDQDQIPPIQTSEAPAEELVEPAKPENTVSQMLGQKLLQGWTMLQECCMNDACNGVFVFN